MSDWTQYVTHVVASRTIRRHDCPVQFYTRLNCIRVYTCVYHAEFHIKRAVERNRPPVTMSDRYAMIIVSVQHVGLYRMDVTRTVITSVFYDSLKLACVTDHSVEIKLRNGIPTAILFGWWYQGYARSVARSRKLHGIRRSRLVLGWVTTVEDRALWSWVRRFVGVNSSRWPTVCTAAVLPTCKDVKWIKSSLRVCKYDVDQCGCCVMWIGTVYRKMLHRHRRCQPSAKDWRLTYSDYLFHISSSKLCTVLYF